MKRLLSIFFVVLSIFTHADAKHLKGGWIQYEYLGAGKSPNTSTYRITVRQYLDCSSVGPQIDGQITVGVFDAATNKMVDTLILDSVPNASVILSKQHYDACINPKPTVCYLINKYVTTVDLPNNTAGYILAVQRCCRIKGIVNLEAPTDSVGITYSNKIPGLINNVSYRNNNSPSFVQKDTVLICYSAPFTYDFSATDADGDSIVYTFCDGTTGGTAANTSDYNGIGAKPITPSYPPFTVIPYSVPLYDGGFPLGTNVQINTSTGIISGIAPPTIGDYVIAVCALEFRNGVLIGSTKKEIHVTVGNCSLSAADLRPQYINCNDLTFSFFNESKASNIISYLWNFGDSLNPQNTSTQPTPVHNYLDTGRYHLTLTVQSQGGCIDSAKSLVKVYPGFKANFGVMGSCIQNPYQFNDSTYSKFGKVNNWSWNLGEPSITTDTFSVQNPTYLYPSLGTKKVKLLVQDSNGCTDSMVKNINVIDKPSLSVPFSDKLICFRDTIQLHAIGVGNFSWIPSDSMLNKNTANPTISPSDTTTYYVTLKDFGCTNTDSIKINVTRKITVSVQPSDTVICSIDSVHLRTISDADFYNWTSNTGVTIPAIKEPTVAPLINLATYKVIANVGKCFASDSIIIRAYPVPTVSAGINDSICYGYPYQLKGKTTGSTYYWSSTSNSLGGDSATLNPTVTLNATSTFVLTAFNLQAYSCPKIEKDTVTIKVFPKVNIKIGNDTSIVASQPLQLMINGNFDTLTATYLWTSVKGIAIGLNNDTSRNPIALLNADVDSVYYIARATTTNGCFGMDTMKVVIYKTLPDLVIPNAFTPEAIQNRIAKPIPYGILQLDYFSIYNRFGQLLYTTNKIGQGWDGTFKGINQPPGTYVFVARARDYTGRVIPKKGTLVLIR